MNLTGFMALTAAVCAFAMPSFAQTITWQELPPSDVLLNQSLGSIAWGFGSDKLTASGQGSGTYINYASDYSADFNYEVTYVGTTAPSTATIWFSRYGEAYAVCGGGGLNASGFVSATAQSTSLSVSAYKNEFPGGQSSGSQQWIYTGIASASAPFVASGSGVWTAHISIPAFADASGQGQIGPAGFGSASSIADAGFEQVAYSVTVD